MTNRVPRIVVSGAGIAGSVITSGLAELDGVEVICLEKVGAAGHADAGTGLNLGPNAVKALMGVMPERAQAMVANSLPWKRWTIGLTNGRSLMDLPMEQVADNPGVRIRWSELYSLLRAPIGKRIVYGAELQACGRGADGLFVEYTEGGSDKTVTISGIDLLISADGRYSRIREHFLGKEVPQFLGVCLYRTLFPVDADCPIDDYGQWFNGNNRLLAFRVPGDLVYCAGSFTLPEDGIIRDEMKTPEALRSYYTPADGSLSRECQFLVEAIAGNVERIHWARLQDGSVRFACDDPGVLLVGDAAHPMVPTLGQGATQAVEDAAVVVDEVRRMVARGEDLSKLAAHVDERRRERVEFVVSFSREATDTMIAGTDSVAGTLKKLEAPFQERLKQLYRDVPAATAIG